MMPGAMFDATIIFALVVQRDLLLLLAAVNISKMKNDTWMKIFVRIYCVGWQVFAVCDAQYASFEAAYMLLYLFHHFLSCVRATIN